MIDAVTDVAVHHDLCEKIRAWDHAYYVEDQPLVADATYDAEMAKLRQLEKDNPGLATLTSPTQRVGGAVLNAFDKVTHRVPCLSLDNVFSEEEMKGWIARVYKELGSVPVGATVGVPDLVAELKIDGLSCSLTYDHGVLVKASTRGDGAIGEDVTANIRTIRSIPLQLKGSRIPDLIEIRGEVYMPHSSFERLNLERETNGEPTYANCRNAAAGALRQLDPSETAKRGLSFFAYALGACEGMQFGSQSYFLHWLMDCGLPVNKNVLFTSDIKVLLAHIAQWGDMRHALDYDTDGMVIKVDDMETQEDLGFNSRSPKWAIAYKYPAEQVTTRVMDVIFQVGRTGAVTPVAVLDPVECGGVTISRATLHNMDEIRRKDIQIRDYVVVQRAGEVIPEVVEVVTSKRTIGIKKVVMPSDCPECGIPVIKEAGQAVYRCTNRTCPAQLKAWIEHWASRDGMDIQGLGPTVIEQLVAHDKVKDPMGLYDLTVADLMELDGVAEPGAKKLIAAIEASKVRPLEKIFFALGIRNASKGTAKRLARRFGTLQRIAIATVDELQTVEDVGPVVAQSVVDFFNDDGIVMSWFMPRLFEKLTIEGTVVPVVASDSKVAGKTFVFTGKIPVERSAAETEVEKYGGKASGSVSKKTDFVVAGDAAGSKLEKAKSLGVPILSYDEFVAMLGS